MPKEIEEIDLNPKEMEEIDLNPITEVRTKKDGALIIEQTHKNPVKRTTVHTIASIQEKIAKYETVIAVWQAKIDPLQALIDEYEGMEE